MLTPEPTDLEIHNFMNVPKLRDACEYLNAFYVETRYHVHWPTNFSYEETEKALRAADQVRSVIKEKIVLQK